MSQLLSPIYKIEDDNISLEVFPVGALQVNCSIITNRKTNEAVVIDAGNDSGSIIRLLKIKGLKVLELLHTHAHFDHIGQSSDVQILTKVPMALHRDDLFMYETLHKQSSYFMESVSPELSPITHFLTDGEILKYGDFLTLKVLHTPGHSPGGISLYTEDLRVPVVFTGDALFHGAIGRTDLAGGNAQVLLNSIREKIFTLPDETVVIPGHEEETTVGEEKRINPYFNR